MGEADDDLHWSDPAAVHVVDPATEGTACAGYPDADAVTTTTVRAEVTCGDCAVATGLDG